MDIIYKLKHHATRALLTVLGPADLDDDNDPRVALKREYEQRYAPQPTQPDVDAAQPAARAIA